ncbi:UNVERIFIED_CONTAM: putative mitochondrial protein [Sesamum latifolium]|uniref:Mitochondrial protein n=1 Tax=Sesamum latifolium TaxID=2727402 RepID=A0AAW2X7L3_9LAMI
MEEIEALRDTIDKLAGKEEIMWKQRAMALGWKQEIVILASFMPRPQNVDNGSRLRGLRMRMVLRSCGRGSGLCGTPSHPCYEQLPYSAIYVGGGLTRFETDASTEVSGTRCLCNVLYKLASKVLANRVKLFLDSLVSSSQATFVPGRLITDNVLVAYELNHFLKLKTRCKHGFISLKLDVSKAYDRVEWRFLESVLIRLGFHTQFVNLIMVFVTSISFSFLLNGEHFGFLRPERGLRQGDPLSPYLFLLSAEAFSGMIRKAERAGLIQGIAISRTAPLVSHLLFADDTLIFFQASEEALQCIKDILLSFEQTSD